MNIWFCAHGNREKWVTVENELKLWSIDTFLLRYFSWLIIQTTQVVRLLYDWRDIAISCWQVTFPWLKSFSVFFFFPVCVKTYPFEMVWIWNFLPTESFYRSCALKGSFNSFVFFLCKDFVSEVLARQVLFVWNTCLDRKKTLKTESVICILPLSTS